MGIERYRKLVVELGLNPLQDTKPSQLTLEEILALEPGHVIMRTDPDPEMAVALLKGSLNLNEFEIYYEGDKIIVRRLFSLPVQIS